MSSSMVESFVNSPVMTFERRVSLLNITEVEKALFGSATNTSYIYKAGDTKQGDEELHSPKTGIVKGT